MIKVKMCGLVRECDIDFANAVMPDFVGFVFAEKSRRYITPEKALQLSKRLDGNIIPVGVFVNSPVEDVADIVKSRAVKVVQIHGSEDGNYINQLKKAVDVPIIKAFIVKSVNDIELAEKSTADYILLDAGMGDGKTFNHSLLENIKRPYFLAGGLSPENIGDVLKIKPYAVDVSSGIETDGLKDFAKMRKFIDIVRK